MVRFTSEICGIKRSLWVLTFLCVSRIWSVPTLSLNVSLESNFTKYLCCEMVCVTVLQKSVLIIPSLSMPSVQWWQKWSLGTNEGQLRSMRTYLQHYPREFILNYNNDVIAWLHWISVYHSSPNSVAFFKRGAVFWNFVAIKGLWQCS